MRIFLRKGASCARRHAKTAVLWLVMPSITFRAELQRRGLPSHGRKAELQARVDAHDRGIALAPHAGSSTVVTDAKGLTSDRFAAIVTASNSAGHAAGFTPAPAPGGAYQAVYNAAAAAAATTAQLSAANAKMMASILAHYGGGRP